MTTDDRQPRSWLLLTLCLLLVASVYARVLDGPMIWDDQHLATDSAATRSLDVVRLFTQPFWVEGQATSLAYYRPLTSLLFACDYWLHGENATGFHVTNLALHLLATSLLFALLRRRGTDIGLGFLLSATWALLPRLTEGAAWISGRGDVVMTVLVLAALWVHLPGSLARLALASLFGLLALLTKESGIAVFGALALLELGSGGFSRPQLMTRLFVLALPIVIYAALRTSAGATSLGDGTRLGVVTRGATILEALGRYCFMLLDPFQPRSLIGRVGRLEAPYIALGFVVLVALLLTMPRVRRLASETQALTVLGALPLLMVLHLTALPFVTIAADRYLYLPTAALLLAAAPALQLVGKRRQFLLAGTAMLMVACAVRTFARVGDYVDEARFWVVAARATPDDGTAIHQLGNVAYRAGLFWTALALDGRALPLAIGTDAGDVLQNIALAAMASGDRVRAARMGDELVRRFPRNPDYELHRAVIALNAHDFEQARAHAQKMRELVPDPAPADAFLSLVERSRAATQRPGAPAALVQSLDAEAMRCPEIASRLERLLDSPADERATIQSGVDFVIAHCDPQQARASFENYRRRFGDADSQRLAEALAVRVADAANVQMNIDAFLKAR